MKRMIRKMYENDITMGLKMNMIEIGRFQLVNPLKQDKVHLKQLMDIEFGKIVNSLHTYR